MSILKAALLALFVMSSVFSVKAGNYGTLNDIPEITSAFAPVYPEGARAARAEGTVTVLLRISNDGSVKSASFLEGNKLFSTTVETAARKWTFAPSRRRAEREAVITFVFVLLPESSSIEEEGVVFEKHGKIEIKRKLPTVEQMISNG